MELYLLFASTPWPPRRGGWQEANGTAFLNLGSSFWNSAGRLGAMQGCHNSSELQPHSHPSGLVAEVGYVFEPLTYRFDANQYQVDEVTPISGTGWGIAAGLFKLSPLFPHDPHVMFSKFESPAQSAPRSLQSSTLRAGADGVCEEGRLYLPCPAVDYIDPEYIDLLITDTGGYTPSYIYRLLAEYYSREDYALSRELLERMVRH